MMFAIAEKILDSDLGGHIPQLGRANSFVPLHWRLAVDDADNFLDSRARWFGEQNLENVRAMLESLSLLPFTAHLGWTREQVDTLVARARQELADPSLRPYIPL
jgi:hypothetical protein